MDCDGPQIDLTDDDEYDIRLRYLEKRTMSREYDTSSQKGVLFQLKAAFGFITDVIAGVDDDETTDLKLDNIDSGDSNDFINEEDNSPSSSPTDTQQNDSCDEISDGSIILDDFRVNLVQDFENQIQNKPQTIHVAYSSNQFLNETKTSVSSDSGCEFDENSCNDNKIIPSVNPKKLEFLLENDTDDNVQGHAQRNDISLKNNIPEIAVEKQDKGDVEIRSISPIFHSNNTNNNIGDANITMSVTSQDCESPEIAENTAADHFTESDYSAVEVSYEEKYAEQNDDDPILTPEELSIEVEKEILPSTTTTTTQYSNTTTSSQHASYHYETMNIDEHDPEGDDKVDETHYEDDEAESDKQLLNTHPTTQGVEDENAPEIEKVIVNQYEHLDHDIEVEVDIEEVNVTDTITKESQVSVEEDQHSAGEEQKVEVEEEEEEEEVSEECKVSDGNHKHSFPVVDKESYQENISKNCDDCDGDGDDESESNDDSNDSDQHSHNSNNNNNGDNSNGNNDGTYEVEEQRNNFETQQQQQKQKQQNQQQYPENVDEEEGKEIEESSCSERESYSEREEEEEDDDEDEEDEDEDYNGNINPEVVKYDMIQMEAEAELAAITGADESYWDSLVTRVKAAVSTAKHNHHHHHQRNNSDNTTITIANTNKNELNTSSHSNASSTSSRSTSSRSRHSDSSNKSSSHVRFSDTNITYEIEGTSHHHKLSKEAVASYDREVHGTDLEDTKIIHHPSNTNNNRKHVSFESALSCFAIPIVKNEKRSTGSGSGTGSESVLFDSHPDPDAPTTTANRQRDSIHQLPISSSTINSRDYASNSNNNSNSNRAEENDVSNNNFEDSSNNIANDAYWSSLIERMQSNNNSNSNNRNDKDNHSNNNPPSVSCPPPATSTSNSKSTKPSSAESQKSNTTAAAASPLLPDVTPPTAASSGGGQYYEELLDIALAADMAGSGAAAADFGDAYWESLTVRLIQIAVATNGEIPAAVKDRAAATAAAAPTPTSTPTTKLTTKSKTKSPHSELRSSSSASSDGDGRGRSSDSSPDVTNAKAIKKKKKKKEQQQQPKPPSSDLKSRDPKIPSTTVAGGGSSFHKDSVTDLFHSSFVTKSRSKHPSSSSSSAAAASTMPVSMPIPISISTSTPHPPVQENRQAAAAAAKEVDRLEMLRKEKESAEEEYWVQLAAEAEWAAAAEVDEGYWDELLIKVKTAGASLKSKSHPTGSASGSGLDSSTSSYCSEKSTASTGQKAATGGSSGSGSGGTPPSSDTRSRSRSGSTTSQEPDDGGASSTKKSSLKKDKSKKIKSVVLVAPSNDQISNDDNDEEIFQELSLKYNTNSTSIGTPASPATDAALELREAAALPQPELLPASASASTPKDPTQMLLDIEQVKKKQAEQDARTQLRKKAIADAFAKRSNRKSLTP